jgi:quinohemoprotein ethanol dehydrogenase
MLKLTTKSFGAALICAAIIGSESLSPRAQAASAELTVATHVGWVDETLMKGGEAGNWVTTGRDGTGQYYSPLSDINRNNIQTLGYAWDFKLGTRRGLEATPLVVDGVMYATGNWGTVYALDAANGRLLWTYNPMSETTANPQAARYEQNDVVNRGAVVWKGRVYVLASDCRLIALSAGTGAKEWEVDSLVDRSLPYACSGAPQLAGSLVVVGNAGADTSPGGLRGYVSAFDSDTGALRWRFFTVPSSADKSPPAPLTAAAKTWSPVPKDRGGGNVWNAMAYDATRDLLFLGTGNAAPYGAPRDATGQATDSLYTASIVALHAQSGALVWYFQTTPGDRWDFDATANLILTDLKVAGQQKPVLLQANKNGFFYVIDRISGHPICAKPFAYINWTTGLDREFRPIPSSNAEYHSSPKLIYPSVQGAHSWTPMSYSPKSGLAYIPAIDAPSFLIDLTRNGGASMPFVDEATTGVAYVVPDQDYDPAFWSPLVGGLPKVPSVNPGTGKPRVRSSIKAWDPIAQKVVWENETSAGYLVEDGGTLATGGDLVFAGREDGNFVAYDATSGKVLKVLPTGTPIMAAPMTYKLGGTQYVAVMGAHGGGYLGSFVGTVAMNYVNDGRILVFKVGGASQVPLPPAQSDEPLREPPAQTATPEQIESGLRLFNMWCARCHSLGTRGVTPDLSRLKDGAASLDVFQAIVLKGAFLSRGMARFDDALSSADTEAIHAYLVDQAWQAYRHMPKEAGAGGDTSSKH